MRITFIGHASILIETRGIRVLSDPWWRGPCFGAQWWNYPPPKIDPVREGVDYIYISHGHHDHLHPGTLRTLNRNAAVLVSRNIGIAQTLRDLSFRVSELNDDSRHELATGVHCRIIETHAADTLFTIEDGESVCVNLNDSLHAARASVQDRFIAKLKSLYPRIDYLFCGYGVASHFPNCYRIPGKDAEATAARRQSHFNRQWVRIVQALSPRFAFPFAADVALLEEDLLWSNEPTHNRERPTALFRSLHPQSSTSVIDIAPGFVIEGTTIANNVLRQPASLADIRREYADSIKRANTYGAVSDEVFEQVLRLLRDNVNRCLPYLREHESSYRFLVQFRNHARGVSIVKQQDVIDVEEVSAPAPGEYDLVYTTRLHYVRWSLTTEHGHEILFVGSGGSFQYARQDDAKRNLHRELATVLTPHVSCPGSRFGNNSPFMYRLKRALKSALRAPRGDLYDLGTWTVWKASDS